MQIIGLCRFSFPALGDFQIEHDTIKDRRRHLYNSARLKERLSLFESVTLPSFRAQTDEDFQFLVVVGDCLPKLAFDRLNDLTADIRQVQIIQRPVDQNQKHRQTMKQILQCARLQPDQPCLQFRHDDDDGVSVDFIERLRDGAQDGAGLIKKNQAIGIDFNNGYQASFGPNDIQAAQVYKSLLGVGLGMLIAGNCAHTIISFTHNRIGRFMPVISYPDRPMWIRSLNSSNDSSRAEKQKSQLAPITPDTERAFAERFAIDLDFVRRAHSSA
ncbi:Putative rhamnosyl transferase [Ruegeria halocynthiae]|uniref:Putative rhamnosyl transferase n=1 Tax=Ruegeria halocynthiae TaxID=985054 RepID=A0A1H3C8F8_9RHOB|nr:glycosyltransferase [Ruegeria halocynthiae]SDX50340.1 Putative rhamnosyl transferase [Ruegeria halocynthiae]